MRDDKKILPALRQTWPLLLLLCGVAAVLRWTGGPGAPLLDGDPLSRDPLLRAAGVSRGTLPDQLRGAADADWRVRAAAFAALDAEHPFADLPARDTPMAQREQRLIAWMETHHPERAGEVCEIFAPHDTLQFSAPLIATCLACHAGPEPEPRFTADRCVDCHADVHTQWSRSAHANSLSHLDLATVDPQTRTAEAVDFGPRRGMSCVACHEPAGLPHPPAPTEPAVRIEPTDPAPCVATFTARACGDCHADVQSQWQAWKAGPQPQRAAWPPGSIDFAVTGRGDSCVDCHMVGGDHRWAARRDPVLLRSGIDLALRPTDDGVSLALTNLSGHAYPTGTHRRALEVFVSLDGGREQRIAALSPAPPAQAANTHAPALQPGEQRLIALPGHPSRVNARLEYVRNRYRTDGYRVEITTLQRQVDPR